MTADTIAPDARAWLKRAALRHLARREHARQELEAKLLDGLRRWRRLGNGTGGDAPGADTVAVSRRDSDAATCADRAAVAAVLDELNQRGLQSDDRTAEVLINARSTRFGMQRLRADLKRRGVPRELADRSLAALAGTELARAAALWQRRFGASPTSAAERARQMRWLAARGFSGEVARRVVTGRSSNTGSDNESDAESENESEA